jgi:DNA-binding transcriptional MerR regulator
LSEYRIEDLARETGATVRNIRAYQDRGLLPKPGRRGRINVYDDTHLNRLRQIAGLLDRGYTLASIKELLEAWDSGRGLGGVLGLLTEVDRPWSDETPARMTRDQLTEKFGGRKDDDAVAEAVALGVLEQAGEDEFIVPSPKLLTVASELHSAGVPLPAIVGHLRELRTQVEHIAQRFLEFTAEHVFQRYLDHNPTDAEAREAAELIRRMRPLAWHSVDAELARAMRALATRHLQHALGTPLPEALPHAPANDLRVEYVARPHGIPALPPDPSPASPSALPATVRVEVTIPEETATLLRALLERSSAGSPG